MVERNPMSYATLDELSAAARERISPLRNRVIRKANGALGYDYIVPNGVYEELWDWDAFFVGLHLISEDRNDGIYLKNWCLNFLAHTEPDGHTPGGIRPWAGRDARLYHIKPLMGQAAFYASRSLGDFGWIEPVWEMEGLRLIPGAQDERRRDGFGQVVGQYGIGGRQQSGLGPPLPQQRRRSRR